MKDGNMREMGQCQFNQSKESLLYFEFINRNNEKVPLYFVQPIKMIKAETIDEVVPALNKVEDAIQAGYYAAGYMTYEAAPALDPTLLVKKSAQIPYVWFGIYEQPSQISVETDKDFSITSFKPDTTINDYEQKFQQILRQIKRGTTE